MLMPSSEASHQFEAGNKGAIKTTIGAKAGELWMVPIDMIRVVEGFNIRIQDEANEDAIEKVKDSILANGFYKNQPLKGYIGKEDGEDVLICSGGFTRLEAARRAQREGCPIKELPVVLAPPGTSMADLTVGLIVDNDGRPNTPYERGIAAKRLINWGWDEKEIALRLGLSHGYVKELLYLHSLPPGLQNLVIAGHVKAGHVINAARTLGPEAALTQLEDEISKLKETDPPVGTGTETKLDREAKRPRPRNFRRGVTSRVALGAIDYVIDIAENYDPADAISFLQRWRKEEAEAVDELKAHMKAPKPKSDEEEL